MLDKILIAVRLKFCKNRSYRDFYDFLGFLPGNIELYESALSHKSLLRNSNAAGAASVARDNERLEFLGDAILDAIVADILYRNFPDRKEGFLTKTKSKIVQRDSLNRLSEKIGLTRRIRNSIHEHMEHTNIGGNALEALIGAIYLDKGYDFCYRFVRDEIISKHYDLNVVAEVQGNFKSMILEWGQKRHVKIVFSTEYENTIENNVNIFKTVVYAEDVQIGQGKGASKKESQQKAAEVAVNLLKNKAMCDSIKARSLERREAMRETVAEAHED